MSKKTTVKQPAEEKISLIKKISNSIKSWIVGNGIEGVLGFILGLILWSFGFKVYAGFAFGVFATRNWDLLKNGVKNLLKK
jgi:predicted small integral membrane protein